VHTSAKARLASVVIRIRDPDRHQNLVICLLAHCQPSVNISCNSVQTFLLKVANRQTKNDDCIFPLGGGNNIFGAWDRACGCSESRTGIALFMETGRKRGGKERESNGGMLAGNGRTPATVTLYRGRSLAGTLWSGSRKYRS